MYSDEIILVARGPEWPRGVKLTWAQEAIHQSFKSNPMGPPVVAMSVEVAPALDMRHLLQRLQNVLDTWDELRTVFSDRDGVLMQRVEQSSSFPIRVLNSDEANWRAVADAEGARLVETPFLRSEPVARFTVVNVHGTPRMVVFALNHLVADAGAARVLKSILGNKPGAASNRPPGVLERLSWEASAKGSAMTETAATYWQRKLDRSVPDWRRSSRKSHLRGDLISMSLTPALRLVDAGGLMSSSAAVLDAFLRVLSKVLSPPAYAIELFASNRVGAWRDYRGCIAQSALVVAEPSRDPSGRGTHVAILNGLRHSQYAPEQVWSLFGGKDALNGMISIGFNDLREPVASLAARVAQYRPTEPGLRGVLDPHATSVYRPGAPVIGYLGRFVVTCVRVGPATSIGLMAPSGEFEAKLLEAVLRNVEEEIVAGAMTGSLALGQKPSGDR